MVSDLRFVDISRTARDARRRRGSESIAMREDGKGVLRRNRWDSASISVMKRLLLKV